tara:strand:- start:1000 stop:1674 length:675 start_codon:yes stop_codon:yes gene_type:complete
MVLYKMGKARKADTVTKEAEVPSVNVEVVTDTSKKVKAPKAPKVAKAVKETEVVLTQAPVVADVADAVEAADTGLSDTFTQFLGKLQSLASAMNALKTEFRALEKKASRELKAAQKINAKRKRKSGNRSPSGFVKPTLISDELAKFLSKPSGTEMARTEVTREINGYIRAHNLQDKTNGRKINPDASLASLLKIKNGEELTYFNLQRYMSPHFAKASAPKPVTA